MDDLKDSNKSKSQSREKEKFYDKTHLEEKAYKPEVPSNQPLLAPKIVSNEDVKSVSATDPVSRQATIFAVDAVESIKPIGASEENGLTAGQFSRLAPLPTVQNVIPIADPTTIAMAQPVSAPTPVHSTQNRSQIFPTSPIVKTEVPTTLTNPAPISSLPPVEISRPLPIQPLQNSSPVRPLENPVSSVSSISLPTSLPPAQSVASVASIPQSIPSVTSAPARVEAIQTLSTPVSIPSSTPLQGISSLSAPIEKVGDIESYSAPIGSIQKPSLFSDSTAQISSISTKNNSSPLTTPTAIASPFSTALPLPIPTQVNPVPIPYGVTPTPLPFPANGVATPISTSPMAPTKEVGTLSTTSLPASISPVVGAPLKPTAIETSWQTKEKPLSLEAPSKVTIPSLSLGSFLQVSFISSLLDKMEKTFNAPSLFQEGISYATPTFKEAAILKENISLQIEKNPVVPLNDHAQAVLNKAEQKKEEVLSHPYSAPMKIEEVPKQKMMTNNYNPSLFAYAAPPVILEPVVDTPVVVPPGIVTDPVLETPQDPVVVSPDPVINDPPVVLDPPPIDPPVVVDPSPPPVVVVEPPPVVVPPEVENPPVVVNPPVSDPVILDPPVVSDPVVVDPPVNPPVLDPIFEDPVIDTPVVEDPPINPPVLDPLPVVEDPPILPPYCPPYIDEDPMTIEFFDIDPMDRYGPNDIRALVTYQGFTYEVELYSQDPTQLYPGLIADAKAGNEYALTELKSVLKNNLTDPINHGGINVEYDGGTPDWWFYYGLWAPPAVYTPWLPPSIIR